MRRRLKEEWQRTEVPAAVARRARDRAWQRLHPARRGSFGLVIAFAAAAIAILTLLWLWPKIENRNSQPRVETHPATVPSAVPPTSSPGVDDDGAESERAEAVQPVPPPTSEVPSTQKAPPRVERQRRQVAAVSPEPRRRGSVDRPAASPPKREAVSPSLSGETREAASGSAAPVRKRLVMHFRLPKSGVRMIWIQDPHFRDNGGGQ